MSKSRSKSKKDAHAASSVVDPTTLKPFTRKAEDETAGTAEAGDKLVQVVIETPKGSRNKYSFDQDQKTFVLKAALPAGMSFPYDFGFVPRTLAGDGDPLDVLVLMDEPAFPGCALAARLIGVIEGEQSSPKMKPVRNDRLVAVAETTHMYAKFKKLRDMPKQALKELQEFFVNYHRLQGKKYKLLGIKGEGTALKLIAAARKAAH
ncbi:MAG TPA: inorganic diphosphatase [Acidobacteriaceae bacterium]|jgi:inorganic pyrophosphatase